MLSVSVLDWSDSELLTFPALLGDKLEYNKNAVYEVTGAKLSVSHLKIVCMNKWIKAM